MKRLWYENKMVFSAIILMEEDEFFPLLSLYTKKNKKFTKIHVGA